MDGSNCIHFIGDTSTEGDSSLFSAFLCNGAVEGLVLADQGSLPNLISPSLLANILAAYPSTTVENLPQAVACSTAGSKGPDVICRRQIRVDVLLRVRHRTRFMLRRVVWMVGDEEVAYVYLDSPLLSPIGLGNQALLAAACDRHAEVVDVPELLQHLGSALETSCGTAQYASIHSITSHRSAIIGSKFHSAGGVENDFLSECNVYVELGKDDPDELTRALQGLVAEAAGNAMSSSGCNRLTALLYEHRSLFRISLGT